MTILVGGVAIPSKRIDLDEILDLEALTITGEEFKAEPQQHVSSHKRNICILQSECCTVPWNHGGTVGSQDATTCVIAFICSGAGATVVHFDQTSLSTDVYLERAVKGIESGEENVELHLVGGFSDEECIGEEILIDLLEYFHSSSIRFNLRTAVVGKMNTQAKEIDSISFNAPIYTGACVDLSSRKLHPASFEDQGPKVAIRQCRVMTGGPITDIYDSSSGKFVLKPWDFSLDAATLQTYKNLNKESDESLLMSVSTSPLVESCDFVKHIRASLEVLIAHPNKEAMFASTCGQPEEFEWVQDDASGNVGWTPCLKQDGGPLLAAK